MRYITTLIFSFILLGYSQTSLAERTFYIGASYGQTTYDTGVTSMTGTAKLDDEAETSKVLVGMDVGYFDLIAEVYYADMGSVTFTANAGDTVTSESGVNTIPVNGYKDVTENTATGLNLIYKVDIVFGSIYAKAGAMYWSTESETSIGGVITETETQSGVDALVGLGYEFSFAPFTSLRIDYEQTKIDEDPVSTISAAIIVSF
ncbi:MAG: outer membrane beta-barrel protein [Gammaproteobacteria bacterium]|nr:outer membrane beta-barrel protein [Gammaproteobacteria bacterium]